MTLAQEHAHAAGLQLYRSWKLWIEPERLRMRRVVRDWLNQSEPGSVVVEVGSGNGFLEPVVRRAIPDVVYLGGDIAPTDRTTVVLDATAMPLATGVVDVVMAVEVLEHMPDPQALLAEASRVLRPGGRLVLTVPFMFGVHDFRDYHRFTPLGFEQLAHQHQLVVTETRLRGGTFVSSTGLVRNLILNTIVGKPGGWRAHGRARQVKWVVATAVLTPWTLVTWAAFALDSLADRESVSPPGYFFLCTRRGGVTSAAS